MAAGTMNKGAQKGRGKMPTKQTINMALVGAKPFRFLIAIPIILVILIAAAAIAKFAVLDRLDEAAAAESEVVQLQTLLNVSKAKLASYEDVIEKYAHYTYSGLNSEELNRVDRNEIINLIQEDIIPNVILENWYVSGNQLTMNILAPTLQDVNMLAQHLNQKDIVDFASVRSATTVIARYDEEPASPEEEITEPAEGEPAGGEPTEAAPEETEPAETDETEPEEEPEEEEVEMDVAAQLVVYLSEKEEG